MSGGDIEEERYLCYLMVSPDVTDDLCVVDLERTDGQHSLGWFVKFGDGDGASSSYRRANPSNAVRTLESRVSHGQISDPKGKLVDRKIGKVIEWAVFKGLVSMDEQGMSTSEWYFVYPHDNDSAKIVRSILKRMLDLFPLTDWSSNAATDVNRDFRASTDRLTELCGVQAIRSQ